MPIILTDEWTKRKGAAAIPGSYWDTDVDAWVMPDDPTPRAAALALQLFPNLVHENPELLDIRAELIREARPVDYAVPYWEKLGRPDSVGAHTVEAQLRERGWWWKQGKDERGQEHWQLSDITFMRDVLKEHGGFELGWARGMGKTLATAAVIDALGLRSTLVVAPNTAKQATWASELEWALPTHDVFVLPNEAKKRSHMLWELQAARSRPFILVVHYEALAIIAGVKRERLNRKTGKAIKLKTPEIMNGWAKLGIEFDLKVGDEGHRFSNPDAQQSKAWRKVPARMRLLLTGSSFQNKWEELFGQLKAIYPERYEYPRRDWCARFLDYISAGYSDVCVGILPERVDAMRDELGRFMVLREKVPTYKHETLYVDLTPEQQRAYDELAESCLVELADGTTVKAKAGVSMLTRLRQIATGLELLTRRVADSSKLDAAIATIQQYWDRGDDFVVFVWYKESAYALSKRLQELGITTPYVITGDVPHKDRAKMIAEFQNGEGRVLIGTIPTMGESINLQRANHVIRVDRSFNPAMNQQAVDRCDRQGQERQVYLTDILARNTVDQFVVLPTILNKEAMRAIVFGDAAAQQPASVG